MVLNTDLSLHDTTNLMKLHHSRYLNEFRTTQCTQFLEQQCQFHRPYTCFHWHFPNQMRRRPIKRVDGTFNYNPDVYCDKYNENNGNCPDGLDCPYAHRNAGDTERRYHPRYFKTGCCIYDTLDNGTCVKNGLHCAFAHGPEDLRIPVYDIREIQDSTLKYTVNLPACLEKERVLAEDPKWNDMFHVLTCYKTELCKKPPRMCRQGYSCPFYHNGKDKRRAPDKYRYKSTPCPAVRPADEWLDSSLCEHGDHCLYCHTRTEQQFHPDIYNSSKCNDVLNCGYCPRGPFCAFAHVDSEMNIGQEYIANLQHKWQSMQEAAAWPAIASTTLQSLISKRSNAGTPSSSSGGVFPDPLWESQDLAQALMSQVKLARTPPQEQAAQSLLVSLQRAAAQQSRNISGSSVTSGKGSSIASSTKSQQQQMRMIPSARIKTSNPVLTGKPQQQPHQRVPALKPLESLLIDTKIAAAAAAIGANSPTDLTPLFDQSQHDMVMSLLQSSLTPSALIHGTLSPLNNNNNNNNIGNNKDASHPLSMNEEQVSFLQMLLQNSLEDSQLHNSSHQLNINVSNRTSGVFDDPGGFYRATQFSPTASSVDSGPTMPVAATASQPMSIPSRRESGIVSSFGCNFGPIGSSRSLHAASEVSRPKSFADVNQEPCDSPQAAAAACQYARSLEEANLTSWNANQLDFIGGGLGYHHQTVGGSLSGSYSHLPAGDVAAPGPVGNSQTFEQLEKTRRERDQAMDGLRRMEESFDRIRELLASKDLQNPEDKQLLFELLARTTPKPSSQQCFASTSND